MELRTGFKYKCVVGGSDFTVGKTYLAIKDGSGDIVVISDHNEMFDDWGLDAFNIKLEEEKIK